MPASEDSGSTNEAFAIAREFNAPRQLVWKAWSEAGRLKEWWGPKGCTIQVARLEFRPGGFFHYAMEFSSAPMMWGRFMYREIAAPDRIAWLNSFSNEKCGVTRAPFSQHCPLEIYNTITLTERAGITTVLLRAVPHGETEEERKFFDGLSQSLAQGYGGTFDQLTDHLAKA